MARKAGIITPSILPGEKGWEAQQKKKLAAKMINRVTKVPIKAPTQVGAILLGDKAFRFGRGSVNFKGDKKYAVWRYKRKIGEINVMNPDTTNQVIDLKFERLGGIGNHKHLIQDADFQLEWMTREQELLMTQKECYLCNKKISKTAQPNLYHYNLFKRRTGILENADTVPSEVVEGKLSISQGWEKFNQIIEEGNRYYMSLIDTALICAVCAKKKGLR
ncbi:MAG: hypothetical protein ACI83O_000028 [Patescibacteria group bacterium]|jgi:hypothetical protein